MNINGRIKFVIATSALSMGFDAAGMFGTTYIKDYFAILNNQFQTNGFTVLNRVNIIDTNLYSLRNPIRHPLENGSYSRGFHSDDWWVMLNNLFLIIGIVRSVPLLKFKS